MKAILEFIYPDDRVDHLLAVHATDWALTVYDIDNEIRNKVKHGHKFETADESLEWVRTYLRELLEERFISLDMIE